MMAGEVFDIISRIDSWHSVHLGVNLKISQNPFLRKLHLPSYSETPVRRLVAFTVSMRLTVKVHLGLWTLSQDYRANHPWNIVDEDTWARGYI